MNEFHASHEQATALLVGRNVLAAMNTGRGLRDVLEDLNRDLGARSVDCHVAWAARRTVRRWLEELEASERASEVLALM